MACEIGLTGVSSRVRKGSCGGCSVLMRPLAILAARPRRVCGTARSGAGQGSFFACPLSSGHALPLVRACGPLIFFLKWGLTLAGVGALPGALGGMGSMLRPGK